MANHHFDEFIAEEHGLIAAILFQNLWYWCEFNEQNNQNFHEGRYWTYNSKEAFAKQFRYLSYGQVKAALKTLRDAGLVVTGNFNSDSRDRTLWYSVNRPAYWLTNEEKAKAKNGQLHWSDSANGVVETSQSYNEADNKHTDNKHNPPIVPQGGRASGLERFDEFWDAYKKKVGKKEAMDVWKRKNLDRIADEIIPKAMDRANRDPDWLKQDRQFQPQASKYLRHERWNDEYNTETRHENTSRPTRKQTVHDKLAETRRRLERKYGSGRDETQDDGCIIEGEFYPC